MILHSLQKMREVDINNVLIVTGREHIGHIVDLLGSGSDYGIDLTYKVQDVADGIAGALRLAESFVGNDSMLVLLGDNIFWDDISHFVNKFKEQQKGAKVLLSEVNNPQRFGVPVIKENTIIGIEEKPDYPKSNYAVTGIYMYDCSVFDVIRGLIPSNRGEYEVTDINNFYLQNNLLTFDILSGWWTDAGTHLSLMKANELVSDDKYMSRFSEIFDL